jgi:hypothetical protein
MSGFDPLQTFGRIFGLDGHESYRELRLALLYCPHRLIPLPDRSEFAAMLSRYQIRRFWFDSIQIDLRLV